MKVLKRQLIFQKRGGKSVPVLITGSGIVGLKRVKDFGNTVLDYIHQKAPIQIDNAIGAVKDIAKSVAISSAEDVLSAIKSKLGGSIGLSTRPRKG